MTAFIGGKLGLKPGFVCMKTLYYKFVKTPVGELKIVANCAALVAILWDSEKPNRVKLLESPSLEIKHPILLETEKQLSEYFLNQRQTFDLPFELAGTPFQSDIWNLLQQIPYGSTWSYKDVATKIGKPNAVRAVGTAIGRNPISIMIPCHRVIASSGHLAGFAGGLEKKEILLALETQTSKKGLKNDDTHRTN